MTTEKVPAAPAGTFVFFNTEIPLKYLVSNEEFCIARWGKRAEIAAARSGIWLTLGANAAEIG
jgi:hypothetical protein